MRRSIVCDTGPVLHLSEAGAIHLLRLAGDIFVPPIVASEFESNAQGWKPPQWIEVLELKKSARQQAKSWIQANRIDMGEAEAISLARQINADWLLTDDARARQLAEAQGLEVHGSVGLLLWSIATGHVNNRDEGLRLLDNLAHTSLWISRRVLQEARRAITAMFL